MSAKYIIGSDRYQYKLIGWFLLIISLVAGLIFVSDIRAEYAFGTDGVKSKVIVTGGEFMSTRMGSSQGRPPSQVAFDYTYSVDGKEYENHIPSNYILHNKGDVIDIEYSKTDPSVSRFTGNARNTSNIKLLISVCGLGVIVGLALLLQPVKPSPDEEMDWSEYERTHE